MKLTRNILAVVVLVALTVIATGCADAQLGATKVSLLEMNDQGLSIGVLEQDGLHVVAGSHNTVVETSAQFNQTAQAKQKTRLVERLTCGKNSPLKTSEDITLVLQTPTATSLISNAYGPNATN
ncbi:MAG: hypothetical protein KKF50_05395 [Nanoarchaeota archaeon]|nr:hypothetical protein [Nanoarchaeota archaeon]